MVKINELLSEILTNGYQIEPDAFEMLKNLSSQYDVIQLVTNVIKQKNTERTKLITKQDIDGLLPKSVNVDSNESEILDCSVKILSDSSPNIDIVEGVNGYRFLFSSRYNKLIKIVKQRPDSFQIQKNSRINVNLGKPTKIAGLLLDRKVRKNSVEVIIDDDTGQLIAYAVNDDVSKKISELILDQFVIADVIHNKQGRLVIKGIYSPDIPDKVVNSSKKSVHVVFTSDIHIGSKAFLSDSFMEFLRWISGQSGDLDIVKRIVCVVIAGDLVDGIGVYSGQENELSEQGISLQSKMLFDYLNMIPKNIKIILISGDHEPVRQALPQPPLPRKYFEMIYAMKNVSVFGNPSQFSINGVNVLSYHGKSIEDIVMGVPNLSFARPAQAMKVLLRSRHLSPFYGGRTPIAPEVEDRLVIDQVPDIFHAGHIHVVDLENYRGSLILNSGTWQAQTKYQESVGIVPTPSIVPIVNLATLETMTRKFA